MELCICSTIINLEHTPDETEIIILHDLQMGYSESPQHFCTATETGRDVIEFYYNNCSKISPHPDEAHLTEFNLNKKTKPTHTHSTKPQPALKYM